MSSADQPEDDAAAVLRILEESGVFDELRQQLLQQIQANEKLKKRVEKAVLDSKHLPVPSKDKRALAAACEQIRREITSRTMDYVLETVWEEMDTPGSALVEAINFETHAALCKVYEQRETEKLRL